VSAEAFAAVIRAPARDRLDLFLATANRLGTPVGNIEKDFWICWTLDALYHRLPANHPRLLFKGGTSLSKAYGLIQRFSEDIDVTVFRDDLDQAATVEELEALSGKKQRAKLDAIRNACRHYVTGPLHDSLSEMVADVTNGAGHVEVDAADPDGQTLLVWYPEVEPRDGAYVRPAVRIESGAKSALDPHGAVAIQPYVADEAEGLDLAVASSRAARSGTRSSLPMVCGAGTSVVACCARRGSASRDTTTTSTGSSALKRGGQRWVIKTSAKTACVMLACSSTARISTWPQLKPVHSLSHPLTA